MKKSRQAEANSKSKILFVFFPRVVESLLFIITLWLVSNSSQTRARDKEREREREKERREERDSSERGERRSPASSAREERERVR